MANITKHYTKQIWKCNNSYNSRINFLISWNTISIDYFLKYASKFIQFKMSWTNKLNWRMFLSKLSTWIVLLFFFYLIQSIF
jgi:hypothetical protein